MKKDNIKMMSKIDCVSTVTGDLRANIKKIQEENRKFNTGLKFSQDLQMDEKMRTDKIANDVDRMSEQIWVLQGIVQKQNQQFNLSKSEIEEQKM